MVFPRHRILSALVLGVGSFVAFTASAQTESPPIPSPTDEPVPITAVAGTSRSTLVGKQISFDAGGSTLPESHEVREYLWDFGDGVRTTGEQVSHAYARPGRWQVRLTITTDQGEADDTIEVRVFDRVMVLLADSTVSDDQLTVRIEQAAEEGVLLLPLKAKSGGSEPLVEEELTQALLSVHEEVRQSTMLVTWTAGGVGANVLSRFAQDLKKTDELAFTDLNLNTKGILVLSDTPFAVLSPIAQGTFDQLQPAYVLLTRPDALSLIFTTTTADEAREVVLHSPVSHRLLGAFSSRSTSTLRFTNVVSYGIDYLVNNGVPINNILLILLIPVIATILAFARQVIGIKAFGLITPTMTTLSFLVLGLPAGLVVFVVVLLSGTLTRILLRRLRLLYLPRMALVLTNASLAILALFGFSAALGQTSTLSFSIFPILILTILAEEFIAAQFSHGVRTALRLTGWTLLLVVLCYLIVSWQLLRTLLLSYPEVILLAIPLNVLLGRFSGLRLIEYIRFRELLRYGPLAR